MTSHHAIEFYFIIMQIDGSISHDKPDVCISAYTLTALHREAVVTLAPIAGPFTAAIMGFSISKKESNTFLLFSSISFSTLLGA
jgi:hypothetical protein